MENNITIIVSSRKTEKEKKDFLDNVRNTCGVNSSIIFVVNTDGVSLTQIYDDMIKQYKGDIIVFMHDDIEFLRKDWGKTIVELFDKHKDYGIIGVAGSAQFDKNGAWWNYDKKYGQVLHRKEGKSWLTAFSPLLKNDLEEVVVVDGLFMAVHKNRITKGFDLGIEGFNHYDTSFCIANFLDGKTKIGVTTNIRIAHNSVGELKQEWFDNRSKLIEKYGDKFPLEIKK